jgi:hypothetical protein
MLCEEASVLNSKTIHTVRRDVVVLLFKTLTSSRSITLRSAAIMSSVLYSFLLGDMAVVVAAKYLD